jgi:hypothetical protein
MFVNEMFGNSTVALGNPSFELCKFAGSGMDYNQGTRKFGDESSYHLFMWSSHREHRIDVLCGYRHRAEQAEVTFGAVASIFGNMYEPVLYQMRHLS